MYSNAIRYTHGIQWGDNVPCFDHHAERYFIHLKRRSVLKKSYFAALHFPVILAYTTLYCYFRTGGRFPLVHSKSTVGRICSSASHTNVSPFDVARPLAHVGGVSLRPSRSTQFRQINTESALNAEDSDHIRSVVSFPTCAILNFTICKGTKHRQ